ncbi:hypothetical protein SAMN05421806_119105 [Streptomyces indicus]|uniref:Uncharacterized protein n=2 Tax=Streptomyces indicus TaxID=417292 RepID=A0A1G9HN46_9ACTN|nr:hypothetical protein SAMN05421806_119105 [Streptomyces indicus]
MTDLGIGSMGGLELHSFITSALGTAPTLPTILSAENLRVLARRVEGVLA